MTPVADYGKQDDGDWCRYEEHAERVAALEKDRDDAVKWSKHYDMLTQRLMIECEVLAAEVARLRKQRWIPCSEQFPDIGQWVILLTEAGIRCVAMYSPANQYAWQVGASEIPHRRGMHWMPLPAPPGQEET